MRLLHVTIGVR